MHYQLLTLLALTLVLCHGVYGRQIRHRKINHGKIECRYHLKGNIGVVSSDNPVFKPRYHKKCVWTLETDKKLVIQLRIVSYNFSRSCHQSYMKIYDGGVKHKNLIGKYCNGKSISFTQSTKNKLYILLKFRERHGEEENFQFSWFAVYPNKNSREISRLRKRQAKQSEDKCGGVITGDTGVITTPNYPAPYPPSSICKWIIRGDESSEITLEFKDFELEAHRQCRYDFVRIKDGEERNSKVIGKYCGKSKPNKLVKKGTAVMIEFLSDTLTQFRGFKAVWSIKGKPMKKDCGGVLSGSKSVMTSPNYPKTSGDRVICKWIITVPAGKQVKFQINDLRMTESVDCAKGYLQIKEAKENGGALLGSYCGNKLPRNPIFSKNNVLQVIFLSDGVKSSRGFKAIWSAENQMKSTLPPNSGTDTPCGKQFTQNTGIITRSISTSTCSWKIKVSDGQRISVSFLKVNLADDPDCSREQLEIRDGDENGHLISRTCGRYIPKTVTSSKNELEIRHNVFVAQSSGEFKIYWELFDKEKRNDPFNQVQCGIVNTLPIKTINNVPQGLGTLPWVVGIMGMFGRVHCGGTILSKQWILTAAHCFERLPWTMLWKVRAGEWDLMKNEGKEQKRDINRIFVHPKYNAKTNEHDIALIHLKEALVFNDDVNSACLPSKLFNVKVGEKCSIAGWGARKFLRQPKEPLAHVQPQIVDRKKCNGKGVYDGKVTNFMLCAGGNGADSCQGDGGSGLACLDNENKYKVVGIASWGNGCAFPDKSGVYTDVRMHLEWIKSITGRA